jgi:5-azacytidine-induced protein 1
MQIMEAKHERTLTALKEGWAAELQRQRETWAATEKAKRQAWEANKMAEIKDMTVRVSRGDHK